MIVLLVGICQHSWASQELPQADPTFSIGLQDTTEVGGLLLRTKLDWYFSYDRPEVIRDGISLSNRIPVNLEDFSEIKETSEWKKYGWFEAAFIADSTLAGLPFKVAVKHQAPARLWINGKLVLESGNPSQNPAVEKLSRWDYPVHTGITFREGYNYLLIEHSEHTVLSYRAETTRLENGIDLQILANFEYNLRTLRGVVFGGVFMLLFLLILIHSYLGITFKDKYHLYVLLTSLFLLIHASVIYLDTIVDLTYT